MTSQRRPNFVILIIAVFFLAGVVTAVLGSDPSESAGESTQDPARESILVLGVDDLTADDPRLVAVWHAGFGVEGRELYLLGEAVDRPVCSEQGAPLQTVFSWSTEGGLGSDFLAAFDDSPPTAFVVADEQAFGRLIDQLDGVELNGAMLQSDQVIAVLRALYQNPAGLQTSQEQFLIALIQRAVEAGSRVDPNALVELIPQHAYSSVPPQQLLTLYLQLQPLDRASILVLAQPAAADACDG